MQSLYNINETISNGYITYFLNIISLLAILFAILTIIDNNPIKSLLYLILLFLFISIYLNLIDLTFIGLSYLVIYIGAVSILFIFILMLINIRTSELQNNTKNSLSLALITTILFNYIVLPILPYNNIFNDYLFSINLNNNESIYNNFYYKKLYVTSSNWDSNLIENSNIISIGNVMYTNYNMWLIIASLILILAMVGAIVITIKQDK
jgi:NADH-ubiquinone oxidoreductase chain 6